MDAPVTLAQVWICSVTGRLGPGGGCSWPANPNRAVAPRASRAHRCQAAVRRGSPAAGPSTRCWGLQTQFGPWAHGPTAKQQPQPMCPFFFPKSRAGLTALTASTTQAATGGDGQCLRAAGLHQLLHPESSPSTARNSARLSQEMAGHQETHWHQRDLLTGGEDTYLQEPGCWPRSQRHTGIL